MSHARALSKLDDTEQINRLANKIVNENLNVRAIENITRDIHEQEIKKKQMKILYSNSNNMIL